MALHVCDGRGGMLNNWDVDEFYVGLHKKYTQDLTTSFLHSYFFWRWTNDMQPLAVRQFKDAEKLLLSGGGAEV